MLTKTTNYPGGFQNGLTVRQLPIFETFVGNVWWVSSTRGGNGNKGSLNRPFATIAYAMTRASASNGDVIMVMPYHAETISAAAGIAHNIAGVSVIGLGTGPSRPTITLDTTANATYAITAADAYLENLVFVGNISNVVACITTTKAGTWVNGCEFQNAGTNLDFLTPIKALGTTTGDNNDLKVTNCRWHTIDTDDLEFIEINGTLSRFACFNNFVTTAGTASPLILVATGKLLLGADIGWNRLQNAMTANELFISNDGTTNTGIIHNNYVGHADVTGTHDAGWDGGGFRLFNNLSVSVDNLSGFVLPAIDVNL
jgi:hypothetical protein